MNELMEYQKMRYITLLISLFFNIYCCHLDAVVEAAQPKEKLFEQLHHLAIIPDGNRRWAAKKFQAFDGHQRCFLKVIPEITEKLYQEGLHTLTFWYFSTENWNRSLEEIEDLMSLFQESLLMLLKIAHKQQVKMIHLGRKDRIPKNLLDFIERVEIETFKYSTHYFNFALDYGGRDEVSRAIQSFIRDESILQEGYVVDSKKLITYLDTKNQPHPFPDFVIRTSGEQRLSGFMLWQIAYSEFYFESCHFPDFTWFHLEKALKEYSQRQRRFGK